MPEILGNTTHAKHAVGFNVSLLKGGTITQTIIGAIITGLVVASTVATIILVSVGVGYSSPVANPDTATTFKRVAVTLDVLANDKDPRGGNLTLTQIVVSPAHGTAKIVSNSKIVYQSNGAFSGNDTFSYEVTNSFMTANATVTVQVLNRAPEAVPITKTVSKNVKNSLIDIFNFVGDNDQKISDPDSDVLYAVSYDGRKILSGNSDSFGSITVDPYNGYYYTPVDGFNGVEQFNYTISDGNDTSTSTITLTIANDAPVAVDNVYNVPKYGSMVLDVLSNDYDINGDDFNISSAAGTGYGAIAVDKKFITYITSSTRTKKYSDSFEYTISDGNLEASAIVIVNVYNSAPTVYSKTVIVAKSSVNNLITVDYNDPDRKDLVSLSRVTPALASLSPAASLLVTTTYENVFFECCEWIKVETNNYTISFTPVANTVYTQTLTVTMTDTEAEGTGIITIIVQNTPPVAVSDSAECNKNQQVLINVVANDYDQNSGDTALIQLSAVGWTSATTKGGSVQLYNTTHVLYTAPSNFLGDDVATYVITDQSKDAQGNPDSTSYSKGTINIKVINNPPTPADDTITISKGVTSSLNVLDNDSDPNDGASSVYTINSVSASSIKNILATIQKTSGAKDTLSYTANNEEYTDKLTYDVTDQDGMTSTYKATVTLNVINNAPVAKDDTYSTKWNRSVECSVKDNDEDINGDLAKSTISITSNPSNGAALVVGDKIVYTPSNGFVGTDSFKYKLNDGSSANADSNSATVTITVTNTAPVTVADSATTHWNNPNGILVSPLTNDNDPDGDALVVVSASSDSSAGVASAVDSQTVKFVPNTVSATTGTKQVTYYASDYNMQTAGTINVQVTNTKPVANADSYTLHWAASTTQLSVLSNDADADNDDLSVGSVSGSSAAVNSGSSITYTPKKDGVTDIFQYTATDSVTASDAATVTVKFTNNAQPSVSDSSTTIHWRTFASQNNQQDFTVLNSNTDADSDSLSLTVGASATGISGASCIKTSDSVPKVRVTAPTKTVGTASCTFTVSDGLASSSAKTSVVITNNAPTCSDITVSFNPSYISSGQSFSIASSVTDADSNDIPYLVPGSAIIVGSTYPSDSFQVSGSNLLFKPMATVGDRNYAYTVTDGVSTSAQCAFKIVVSSVSSSDYAQSFDVHWAATSVKLDILAKLTTSTIVRLGSTAASGTATITGGILYFTPLRKIYVDTFTVIVADSGNVESTVTVTVSTFNNVPTASLATQTINWGTSKTIDLLVNYADTDYTNGLESKGTVSSIDKTSLSTKGTVSALSGSSVTYSAPANYVGTDSFKVTATDGLATVTFTVTFNMINTAPVTNTKYFSIHWATHKAGYSMNLATDVTDAEGNTLTYSVTPSSISPSTAGTVAMGTSPNAVATGPSSAYLGKFSFTYSASDSIATTPGTVQVTVYNNMSTPVADSKDVHWKATGITLSPFAKFAPTFKDADGDSLSFVSASAQKGTVSTGTTTLTYNAPGNAIGADVVSYKFTDGAESLQNAATIVNINLFNTAPRAIDKTASGKWSSTITVDLSSSCVDDDSLDTATFNGAVSSIVGGTTSVSGKSVLYTPTSSLTYTGSNGVYTATGSFKFQCTDGLSTATNPGTATITVTNNAPTGTGKSTSINRDYTKTTYDFTWADIATVSDADGDSISYINFASSDAAITVSNIGTGIRLTTSNKFVNGAKSITFKLNDGLHDSVSQLTFTVTFVNSAPVCASNSITLNKKDSIDLSTLFSATDSNNDPFTYALTSSISTDFGTTVGTVFTASATRSGATSVTYTATDTLATSTACTISVTINNRAPVADDISYQVVPVASSYVHSYTYVATDADSDTLTYTATSNDCVSQNLATTLTISTSGAITFTRKSTAVSGSCKLYITVTDNNQLTNAQDTATITFVISSTSPIAKDDRFEINQGQTIRIFASQILANDLDEFNSTSTLTLTSISCPDSTYCHKTPRQVTYNGLPAVELDSDSSTCQADKFRYAMTTGMGAVRYADVYVEFKNCYCAAKIDFVFLLDSSKSIGSTNFDLMRDLSKRITGRMKIADDAIKVSIVKFHNNGTLALKLSSDGTLINSTLTTMSYEAGSTAQVPGLRVAVDALRPANGGRADADKVIYILTDGLANVPCSCTSCRNEWQAKPSVFYNSIQVNILGKYTGNTLNSQLDNLCAYKYTDTSVLNGQTCSYCSSSNYAYCLPCADAVPIASKINSWKRNASGVVPTDLDNPYNGNNAVQWKIVAMAVGDAMSNVWGARQIQGMNYDSTRAMTVSWTDLSSTMSEIVDQSCNQVTTTAAA